MEVGRDSIDRFIRSHYLHRWPGVVVLCLALVESSRPIGCIVFALPPRETMKRYRVSVAWELARLFIEDGTPKNAETWFVARAVRWIQRHRPEVELLVSYADPAAGHQGIIYRAGNWIADGRTDQERKTPRIDYRESTAGPVQNLPLIDVRDSAAKTFSRHAHVPEGTSVDRIPRVSKFRYVYWMTGHEKKRQSTPQLRRPERAG